MSQRIRERKARLDDWLDAALADTFPASDPLASPPPAPESIDGDRGASGPVPATAPTSHRSRR
jgi:hypothetical protein